MKNSWTAACRSWNRKRRKARTGLRGLAGVNAVRELDRATGAAATAEAAGADGADGAVGPVLEIGLAAASHAASVLAWLHTQGCALQHFATAKTSLEAIFLNLTGRSLRD